MAKVYTNVATGYYEGSVWKPLTDTYPDRVRLKYDLDYNASTDKYTLSWELRGNNSHGYGDDYPNRWTYYYSCTIDIDGEKITALSSTTEVKHGQLLKSGTKTITPGPDPISISVEAHIYSPSQSTGKCTLSKSISAPKVKQP
jgi:hypothetical protein